MAYWVQETGTNHNPNGYRSFMCDNLEDIAKLPRFNISGEKQEGDSVSSMPVAPGSDAFVINGGSVFILSKDTNTWVEV